MANNSAMIGLGILTGNSGIYNSFEMPKIETRAQRIAKAAFTTKETTPPWKEKASTVPVSAQVSQIKSMYSIIDKPSGLTAGLSDDVKTVFAAYKATDRLRLLADAAAKPGVTDIERQSLQKAFAKGLTDLKKYLASAPSDKVDLAYGRVARQVQTVGVATSSSQSMGAIVGEQVANSPTAALSGLTGKEKFTITLKDYGVSDTVTIDLSTVTQPPTLSGVAKAANDAIATLSKKNADGSVVLDGDGKPVPRYSTRFSLQYTPPPSTKDSNTKSAQEETGRYALQIQRGGTESVSIDQVGGDDAIMVAAGYSESSFDSSIGSDGKPKSYVSTTSAIATAITRFDRADGDLARKTLSTLTAVDRIATEKAQFKQDSDTSKTKSKADPTVMAGLSVASMVTDGEGNSYIVGTTAGDLGANRSDGQDDMVLTKVSSEGKMLWQRTLGTAGSAKGAAVSLAPDGGIVVAATVTGGIDSTTSDGDMLVTRFDAMGDSQFETLIKSSGTDVANALAVAADGTIAVGGRSGAKGDAFVVTLSAAGKEQARRTIGTTGSGTVRALAFGANGSLVALTNEAGHAKLHSMKAQAIATDQASLDLGTADARSLAVASDGTIAVVGATSAAITGDKVNQTAGGRDGFLTRVASDLTGATTTYLATSGDDQIDSVRFMNGDFYVGGRTNGNLDGTRTGMLDAFVARIDSGTGAIGMTRQFGRKDGSYEPVIVSAAKGGSTALSALGLYRGTLTPTDSTKLEAQTDLRPGDSFKIKVNGGYAKTITIEENDTLNTLTDKVRKATGSRYATVSMSYADKGRGLRIAAQPGQEIELIAGATGRDALSKLGLEARRISAPATASKGAPLVTPGGSFGLDLSDSLSLASRSDAKIALARMEQAVSYSQSAYRSLYWDDAKAARADPPKNKGGGDAAAVARYNAQTASYQAALDRLGAGSSTSFGF
jgi:hypothetical protein